MKNILIILIFFFSTNVVKADFVSIDFISMTHKANEIASGEIICVDKSVFELKVNRSLNSVNHVLTIQKFEDWTCAIRWSDYFVGQKLLVFLVKDENGLYPIGAGNEGELPILDNKVYPSLMTWCFDYGKVKRIKPYPKYKKYDSEEYVGIELELDFMWDYIKILKDCFVFSSVRYSRVKSGKWTCSSEKAHELKNSNNLYAQTFERLITNSNNAYN